MSDDKPLWAPTPPPTQPVSGTTPTWVNSGQSLVTVSGRNVRPWLRVQSFDDVEGDPEVSTVSTVLASSRARLGSVSPTILDVFGGGFGGLCRFNCPNKFTLRRLRLVSDTRDEPTESLGPDAVHVIADPDLEGFVRHSHRSRFGRKG